MRTQLTLGLGLLSLLSVPEAGAQGHATSARLAAIQFVRDSNPMGPNHPGRTFVVESSRNGFGRQASSADSATAHALAGLLREGEDARPGAEVLSCDPRCRAIPARRLIFVVNEPRTKNGVTSVLVETYSREQVGSRDHSSYERLRLEVAQRDGGWVVVSKLEHVTVSGR